MAKKFQQKLLKRNHFNCTLITNEDNLESINKSPSIKKKEVEKNNFYRKCAHRRQKKGLIILPKNVETKIYRLKKLLQKKSIDSEEIRKIIRKKRREEELKLRKNNKHLCFKCRQPGHCISNCPIQLDDDEHINICYYCGSIDHKLSQCSVYQKKYKQSNNLENEVNLPFAKCFICHQKGHLTRNCAKNKNGAFPNGGSCRACGSINHTFKECLKKDTKKPEQPEICLQIYNNVHQSVDVDDYIIPIQSPKKDTNKIVKF